MYVLYVGTCMCCGAAVCSAQCAVYVFTHILAQNCTVRLYAIYDCLYQCVGVMCAHMHVCLCTTIMKPYAEVRSTVSTTLSASFRVTPITYPLPWCAEGAFDRFTIKCVHCGVL